MKKKMKRVAVLLLVLVALFTSCDFYSLRGNKGSLVIKPYGTSDAVAHFSVALANAAGFDSTYTVMLGNEIVFGDLDVGRYDVVVGGLDENNFRIEENSSSIVVVANQQRTLSITTKVNSAVAKIGEVEYINLSEALRAAKNSDTVELLRDVSFDGVPYGYVENFKGTFDGKGHTISDLTLNVVKDCRVGFVAKNSGTIKNVVFNNVTVAANASSVYYAGCVAGENAGTIDNVAVAGVVSMPLSSSVSYVGGICGLGSEESLLKDIQNSASYDITAKDAALFVYELNSSTVTDCVYTGDTAFLNGSARENCILCGYKKGTDNVITGSDFEDKILTNENFLSSVQKEMRADVLDYIYRMATIEWKPKETVIYKDWGNQTSFPTQESAQADSEATGISWPGQKYASNLGVYHICYKDVTYHGLLYAHQASDVDRLSYFIDEDGYIDVNNLPDDFDTKKNVQQEQVWNGWLGWDAYLSTDCSGSVMASWWRACDVVFDSTGNFFPGTGNITAVGPYTYPAFKGGTTKCASIIGSNSVDTMYESYARVWAGDALNSDGHARMITKNAHVVRHFDGSIDGDASYITVTEVGSSLNNTDTKSADGKEARSIWYIDRQRTFATLLTEGGSGYIPLSNKNLVTGKRVGATATITMNFDDYGQVKSDVNIHSLEAEITEKSSGVTQKGSRVFVVGLPSVNGIRYHRFRQKTVNLKDYKDALFAGMNIVAGKQYDVKLTVRLATGTVVEQTNTYYGFKLITEN